MGFFHVIMTFTFNQCFQTAFVSAQNHNVRMTVRGERQRIFKTISQVEKSFKKRIICWVLNIWSVSKWKLPSQQWNKSTKYQRKDTGVRSNK